MTWCWSRPAARSPSTSGSEPNWRWPPAGQAPDRVIPNGCAVTPHPFGISLNSLLEQTRRAVAVDDLHRGEDLGDVLVVGRVPVPDDAQRVDVQVLELLHDHGLVQVACLLDRPVDLKAGVPALLAVIDLVFLAEAGRL